MKKLGKLKLNPEKMLSHDELVSFRGGSGLYSCTNTPGTETQNGVKKYCCHIVPGYGYDDACHTCLTPGDETNCTNPTGLGTMDCVQIDFSSQCAYQF